MLKAVQTLDYQKRKGFILKMAKVSELLISRWGRGINYSQYTYQCVAMFGRLACICRIYNYIPTNNKRFSDGYTSTHTTYTFLIDKEYKDLC